MAPFGILNAICYWDIRSLTKTRQERSINVTNSSLCNAYCFDHLFPLPFSWQMLRGIDLLESKDTRHGRWIYIYHSIGRGSSSVIIIRFVQPSCRSHRRPVEAIDATQGTWRRPRIKYIELLCLRGRKKRFVARRAIEILREKIIIPKRKQEQTLLNDLSRGLNIGNTWIIYYMIYDQ